MATGGLFTRFWSPVARFQRPATAVLLPAAAAAPSPVLRRAADPPCSGASDRPLACSSSWEASGTADSTSTSSSSSSSAGACRRRRRGGPAAAAPPQPRPAKKGVNRGRAPPAKSDLPSKTCPVCGLPFSWRKKWEKNWDSVVYCSERCRRTGRPADGGGGATAG